MEPWYKVVTPRKEVREGRSFNPDEFAIALEQVVAGTAPEDYRKPEQIFSRTCFTRALDADTKGALRNIHCRLGTTILFESTGGQTEKVAHLPELRFALCEPDLDTTSVDTACLTLTSRKLHN